MNFLSKQDKTTRSFSRFGKDVDIHIACWTTLNENDDDMMLNLQLNNADQETARSENLNRLKALINSQPLDTSMLAES